MKIVALLAVRNETRYIRRCLEYHIGQGLKVHVIDNDSTDDTADVAREYLGRGVIAVERLPYVDCYDLAQILARRDQLTRELEADWFMALDADEIRQAPPGMGTLHDAITTVDREGYNAINFDEFVFFPATAEENHEHGDYVESMRHYYFFEPRPLRQIRLWKKRPGGIETVSTGGHCPSYPGMRLYPKAFVMRHYIALSLDYVVRKYTQRVFSQENVRKRRFHGRRATVRSAEDLRIPPRERLLELSPSGLFDKSRPEREHLFFTPLPAATTSTPGTAHAVTPLPAVSSRPHSRTAPCPCNSGKRYKECCGRIA